MLRKEPVKRLQLPYTLSTASFANFSIATQVLHLCLPKKYMTSIQIDEGSYPASVVFSFWCPLQDPRRINPMIDNMVFLRILDFISIILVISLKTNYMNKKIVFSATSIFLFNWILFKK